VRVRALSGRTRLPKVSSLITASPRGVHSREACHHLATFRPQAFSASRRFSPPHDFAGLFHPAAMSRVHPVQGLLPPRSHAPSPEQLPPCRCSPPARAPKDLSTTDDLGFEVFIHAEMRSSGSVISLPVTRSPLRVRPPPGRPSRAYAPVTRCDPLMKFSVSSLRLPGRRCQCFCSVFVASL
jgi:hypothetical protein